MFVNENSNRMNGLLIPPKKRKAFGEKLLPIL